MNPFESILAAAQNNNLEEIPIKAEMDQLRIDAPPEPERPRSSRPPRAAATPRPRIRRIQTR